MLISITQFSNPWFAIEDGVLMYLSYLSGLVFMLKNFTQNPLVNLMSGLILLLTSGYETWNTIEEFSVGTHHGVFLFSVLQILKTLPEVLQGSKELRVSVKST